MRSTPLRIAIVKPEYGIRGGFELVVERIVERLAAAEHDVRVLTFDAWRTDHRPFGVRISDNSWAGAPEYFTLLAQLESCRLIDTTTADLVISTQPPSYSVEHDRHLSLFFHHARMFNDLSPYMMEAGLVDSEVHPVACAAVRMIDDEVLQRVTHVAAGSETVAQRLVDLNGRSNGVSLFHAGPNVEGDLPDTEPGVGRYALCVSRHDFPKRTELFVLAAHLAPELTSVSVGTGSRLKGLRTLDRRLVEDGTADEIDSRRLWCSTDALTSNPHGDDRRGLVEFDGAISDAALERRYREAFCVVAPALLEDYGLTALEAMRYGKPVIVCNDGGHLCHLVEHGVTGLIVEPTGAAIAEAMRFLADNRGAAADMGRNGREVASAYTWERAMGEFADAIEATLS
jgi:glycosyltransferase involved in cell wall biosynthesis